MRPEFKQPIISLQEKDIDASNFTEKEIRKTSSGRTYIKLLQEAIDKKLVKFKKVSQFFKHFAKNEVNDGVCFGQAVEIIKAAKKYSAKKELPKKVSRNSVFVTNCFDHVIASLDSFIHCKKENNKKEIEAIIKSSPYVKKNVDLKKLKAFLEKAKMHPEEIDSKLKLEFNKEKEFSLKNNKKPIKYVSKLLKKDNNSYFLFNFLPKKDNFENLSHVVSAGVNKKPFFYDANRGYRRFKNKKKLVNFIKKEYITKKSEHIFDSCTVDIQHFKGK